jgi:hypothetical protein
MSDQSPRVTFQSYMVLGALTILSIAVVLIRAQVTRDEALRLLLRASLSPGRLFL